MTTIRTKMHLMRTLILVLSSACWQAAQADTTVIEKRTVEVAPVAGSTVPRQIVMLTPEQQARSDYDSRLATMLAQIDLAVDKGWLSAEQADALKTWQAQVVQTHAVMRKSDGGTISREHADQMERFVNSLQMAITMEINKHPVTTP